jgi:predicted MFS family arabinose efflux permease
VHRPRRFAPDLSTDAPAPIHLERDRLTWLLYLCLGVYGYWLYGFNPSIPLRGAELGLSRTVTGLHGTALALGALLAGASLPVLARRVGRRVCLWAGLAGMCGGLVAYTAGTIVWMTLLATLVAGTCGSLLVNTVTGALGDHHGPAGPAAVSEANAMAADLGLLSPLALGLASAAGLGWRTGLLVTMVLAAGVAVIFGGTRVPSPARDTPAIASLPAGQRLPRRYWVSWWALVLAIATEFTLAIWSSQLLAERGLGSAASTASVTAIVGGMALGRVLGARLALRFPVDHLLTWCFGLTIVGFALFWSVEPTLAGLAGLFITGLGVSLQFPMIITRAVATAEGRTDLAVSRGSLGAGTAIGLGPFLLGAIADVVGIRTAFLLVPVMQLLAAVLISGGCGGPPRAPDPAGGSPPRSEREWPMRSRLARRRDRPRGPNRARQRSA